MQVNKWWSQLKTAGSAIYANRHYLELYRSTHPERLTSRGSGDSRIKCTIFPDVYIHPTALVHPTAVVSIYDFKNSLCVSTQVTLLLKEL